VAQEKFSRSFQGPYLIHVGIVNMLGLYSKEPIECFLDLSVIGRNEWFNEEEEIRITKIGLDYKYGRTIFSSFSKEQVRIWIAGAQAAMRQLKDFIGDSIGCKVCNTDVCSESELCIFCRDNQKEKAPYCKDCGSLTIWDGGKYECQNCRQPD
jgi:hypothetical protein